MGDQFIGLMEGPIRAARGHRHFGLVGWTIGQQLPR
jgi:hypothetical protein